LKPVDPKVRETMLRFEPDHSPTISELAGSYFLTADFFLFFATPAALLILDLVRKSESTPLAISRKLGMNQQTVLRKLRAMEREGILVSSVRPKNAFYRMANSQISKAFEQILEFPEKKLKQASRSRPVLQNSIRRNRHKL
jgi:DNA-binding transcriptional ArsR family regulator